MKVARLYIATCVPGTLKPRYLIIGLLKTMFLDETHSKTSFYN